MSNMSPPSRKSRKSAPITLPASPVRNKVSGTPVRFTPYSRKDKPPTPPTPVSSLPPDIREKVEEEHMRGFRPREAKHLRKANVVTLVSYAKSQGLDCKRGRHSRDIIRFVKGPSGTLPIVLLSEDNITGATGLLPSMHAAVYTPSSQMSKILNMRSFHLVLRIGAGREAGFQGQVLYHGVYRASDAQLPLPPERLAALSAEDRRNMLDFFNNSRLKEMKSKAEGRGEPKQDVANIPDADLEKLFETGQQRLALMVLKCLSFDSTFYKELMHADAITLIPVKTVGRIYPNWAKCHAEEMATAAQGLDVGRR